MVNVFWEHLLSEQAIVFPELIYFMALTIRFTPGQAHAGKKFMVRHHRYVHYR